MFGNRVVADRVRSKTLVTLKSGEAFEGVLWDADKQAIVLRNASLLGAADSPSVVDGEVVVLLVDVAYVQVLG